MDPLSITLAVITLATALKDLVELGSKLKDFCAKVSKNDRTLARLCVQLPSDLQELENLYLSNREVMDHSPALKNAVKNLVLKIQNILDQFETLADAQPKSGSKFLIVLKSAFKASDVEHQIKDLKEDISRCYRLFQRLAIARIELTGQKTQTNVERTYVEAQDIRTTAEQTHVAVQMLLALSMEQRQELQVMKSSVQQQLQVHDTSRITASKETNFCKTSQSRTLACLEEHLGNIGVEILALTAAEYAILPRWPVKPFVHHYPVLSYHTSPEKRHRTLLRRVLELLEGLEEHATAIDDHAFALNTLGDIFWSIEMRNEATVVYTWAIDLYRILVRLQPEHFAPFLAEALDSRMGPGDIDEAIMILQPMIGSDSSPDVRCQFAHQLVRRHEFSERSGSRDDELEDAKHALEIIESILRPEAQFVELFTLLDDEDNLFDHLTTLLANRTQQEAEAQTKPAGLRASDFELSGAYSFLDTYATVLLSVFEAHQHSGLANAAQNFLLKAAIIGTHLAATHPDTDLETYLAYNLTLFIDDISPSERKLPYLEEAIKFLRKAINFEPKLYTNDILNALSKKANWFKKMGRREEAVRTWHEVLEIAPAALANRAQSGWSGVEFSAESNFLQSYYKTEESILVHVRSVEIYYRMFNTYNLEQARACRALAADYRSCGHDRFGLRLAELAIQQVRILAFEDPSEYAGELALTFISWINLLPSSTSSDNRFAIEKVQEILDQYEDLIRLNIHDFKRYYPLMLSLINGVDNPSIAQSLSLDVVERLRKLADDHPGVKDVALTLLERQRDHGLLLCRWNLLEAATWLNGLRDEYRHLIDGDEKIASWHINLLLHLGIVLKDQGNLKEAREVLRTAVQTGQQLTKVDGNADRWSSLALTYQAEIEGFLGEDELALELSAESVSSAQSKYLLQSIGNSMGLMPPHSRQLAINKQYEKALSVAESLASRMREMGNPSEYDRYWFVWPSESLRSWATCLADVHKMSEALAIAKQALEEARRVKGTTTPDVRLMAERFYGDALWTLGCIQLFSNNQDDALTTLEEAKDLWKQRSKVRRFEFRNLGLALWALGKLYCVLGRYEAGAAANQKLRKILSSLESSDLTMHLVLSVAIDQERRRPCWVRFLERFAEVLRRGHLEELVPAMEKA